LGGIPSPRHSLQLSQLLSPPVGEPLRRQASSGRDDFEHYDHSISQRSPTFDDYRRPKKSVRLTLIDASTNTDHSGPIEAGKLQTKGSEIAVDRNANLTVKLKETASCSKFKFSAPWEMSDVIKRIEDLQSKEEKRDSNSVGSAGSNTVPQSTGFLSADLKSFVQKQKSETYGNNEF